ncbi:MAG TPA: thioredoxin family protein [Candidatus Saccharimonadales bacterium]|nr:thioredoxin family protein [Candidatus Saccharimonadales bacterium]
MDKRVGLIVLTIVLLVGGSIAYLSFASEPDEPIQNAGAQKTGNSPVDGSRPPEDRSASTPGKYVDYREEIIAETSGTILLFFHASWCPQCRALESNIKAKGVPAGVTIVKVDYDSNQILRQEYGVTIQTTVVRVNKDGGLVEKFVAYNDPSLKAVVEELL